MIYVIVEGQLHYCFHGVVYKFERWWVPLRGNGLPWCLRKSTGRKDVEIGMLEIETGRFIR